MEDKLILKDLTYKIRGLLFEVQNELGNYCKEEQYCDRFEFKIKENGFNYTREYILPKSFEGERHHRNRIDFLIEDVLVVEFKVLPALSRDDYFQCQRYLQSLNLDLCLLINFRPKYLMIKRVLNNQKFNREKNKVSE